MHIFVFTLLAVALSDDLSDDVGVSLLQLHVGRARHSISVSQVGVPYTDWLQSMSRNDFTHARNQAKADTAAADKRAELQDHLLDTSPKPLRIAHVVSLMPDPSMEDLAVLESMAHAKHMAEARHPGKLEVTLVGVRMVGETAVPIPKEFQIARPMNDNTASRWGCNKALPFAAQLIRALQAEAPHADLHVMTNADVGVMPEFYDFLAKRYRLDRHDALNILKVQIPVTCHGQRVAANASLAYKLVRELPQTHPGSETFVWDASRTTDIIRSLGSVFLGYGPVGARMIQAIQHKSKNFATLRGEHLVFHIGAEGERGRGDPGLMQVYMTHVEDEMQGCRFEEEQAARPQKEDKSCPYPVLNQKASGAASLGKRFVFGVYKSILRDTLTWQELYELAYARSGTLPTREQLIEANVSAREAEAWIPVRRVDRKTDDWVQVGSAVGSHMYKSHLDAVGQIPRWGSDHHPAKYRPMYFFLAIGDSGDALPALP